MENAVSYLTILLNDLEQVKNSLSSYNNLKLILMATYQKEITDENKNDNTWGSLSRKMSEEERTQLINLIGYFRAYSTRAYIGFKSISPKFSNRLSDKKDIVEKTYAVIKTEALPKYDTAEAFVQALNDIFVEEINVQALINTAQKVNELSRSSASPKLV